MNKIEDGLNRLQLEFSLLLVSLKQFIALRRHNCLSQSGRFVNYNLLEEILLLMLSFMIVISRNKQNELDGCETILFCRTTVRTVPQF